MKLAAWPSSRLPDVLSFGRMVTQSQSAARRHHAQMRQLQPITDAMIGIKPIRR
jgi:hypothetical protein